VPARDTTEPVGSVASGPGDGLDEGATRQVERRATPRPRPRPRWDRPPWERVYVTALPLVDGVMISVAAFVALAVRDPTFEIQRVNLNYDVLAMLFAPVWVTVLALSRAYEPRFLASGSEEYRRVTSGSLRFAALLFAVSFLIQADLSRGFVGLALVLGMVLLWTGRHAARYVLWRERQRGRAQHQVVVAGSADEVTALGAEFRRGRQTGMQIVAVCVPAGDVDATARLLPDVDVRPLHQVVTALAETRADTLAVAGTRALGSAAFRRLAWDLEDSGVDLVISPVLMELAGPRMHIRPIADLPFLHVEHPEFTGIRRVIKTCFDYVVAAALLSVLGPLLVVVALLIKLTSPGPVFFRQVRLGIRGEEFRVWKFRTMRADAEALKAQLANESGGLLFKVKADPRVTAVGRWLRRFSLDELPQLFNVLGGSMSLVGPRPLPEKLADFDDAERRRLLVKPGITGLWQVSGRSDLSWEDSVRLDLYYVENWSPALDLIIMLKTVGVLVRPRGAY
jgi:exopolysaccharide biosynthesis polyprenyl glycosylphosphotransferase